MITIIDSPYRNIDPKSPASHRQSLEMGLKALGIDYKVSYGPADTKNVAVWGWRKGKAYLEAGHRVLVMERGYIGDRFKYTSLGWDGLNNHASFPEYPNDGGDRFRKHGGVLKRWGSPGEHIIILGQVHGDASLKGQNISQWYSDIAKQIKSYYSIPVYFRPHPDHRGRGYWGIDNIPNIGGDLESSLKDALFTVAYNSNSCLDSIMNGIPCYAGDSGTLAWPLCMEDIKQISYPSREAVVHRIAWNQWEASEIQSGYALNKLMEMAA